MIHRDVPHQHRDHVPSDNYHFWESWNWDMFNNLILLTAWQKFLLFFSELPGAFQKGKAEEKREEGKERKVGRKPTSILTARILARQGSISYWNVGHIIYSAKKRKFKKGGHVFGNDNIILSFSVNAKTTLIAMCLKKIRLSEEIHLRTSGKKTIWLAQFLFTSHPVSSITCFTSAAVSDLVQIHYH